MSRRSHNPDGHRRRARGLGRHLGRGLGRPRGGGHERQHGRGRGFLLGRLRLRAGVLLAVAIAMFGAMTTGALAYWLAHGSGNAGGGVGTLTAPSISGATPGAGTVALTWTSITPPGSGTVSYYVSRDGGAPGGNCPSSGSPATQTSCTDSGVSAGRHEYTVTAVWRSWTAKSAAKSVEVASTAATHLVLTATTTTPTAGTGDNLTITAENASNETATSYTGTKNLTFGGDGTIGANHPTVVNSSGATIDFGGTTTIAFTNGVASVSGSKNGVMKLYRAETANITVSDGTIGNGAGLPVTVGAATATSFAVPTPSTQTAGGAFNETLTALDTYGNTATIYTGSKEIWFSGPSESPAKAKPSYPPSVTFADGEGTASITLYDAQSTTLTATQGTISGSTSFTVAPSTAASFTVANPGTQTAGTAFNEKLTALDAYGNTATNYTGSREVTFSGPSESPSKTKPAYPSSVSFSSGVGTASVTLYDAQSTTLTAKEGTLSGASTSFTINATTTTTQFGLSTPATQTAGTAFNETITAEETYGNTVTSYSGLKTISFSGGAVTGSVTLYDAQSTTLTAKEGTLSGVSASFTVNAATAKALCIVAATSCTGATVTGGHSFTFSSTVGLIDAFNNPASSGASVTVALTQTGSGGGIAPSSLTIPAGQTASTGSFIGTAAGASNREAVDRAKATGLTEATVTQKT
jgi:hypothetical protein